MDSIDLLAREDEFKKLNRQLEKKTETLMKQIEAQMQKQDIFSQFPSLSLDPVHTNTSRPHSCSSTNTTPEKTAKVIMSRRYSKDTPKKVLDSNDFNEKLTQDGKKNSCNGMAIPCDCCPVTRKERIADDLEFLYAFVMVNVQEKVLPQSFVKDKPTVESVCKFLGNKVKLLQEQIDKLQATINKKASQCEVHLTHQAELESERMSLMMTCNNLRTTAESARAKCNLLQKKLDEKDRLYVEQRTSADRLSVEVKRLRSKSAGVEARSAMQEDTVQGLKHQLECAQRAEKDLREASRTLSTQHGEAVQQFKSQVSHLQTYIRKQSALIANLKKQRTLLTASTIVECVDRDYNKLLEHAFQ